MITDDRSYSAKEIIKYYNRTEWVYRNYWKLDSAMGLHFGFWQDDVKSVSEAIIKQNEVMAAMVGIKPNHRVLDAGCGVGGSSIYIAKNIGCEAIGITLSKKQVLVAMQNAIQHNVEAKTKFYEMDYTKTSFDDHSFDVIWAIETICHCSNNDKFLSEAFRILKPGGTIIIADYFQTKKELTTKENKRLINKGFNGWLVSEIWDETLFKSIAEKLGFEKYISTNVNDKVMPSAKQLIKKTKRLILFGWLYYKIGGITNTEYYNALGTINICKTLGKLWDYKIIQISKPLN